MGENHSSVVNHKSTKCDRLARWCNNTYCSWITSSDSYCIRYSVLDLILRTIEELSTMDNCSEEICENKELLQLARELIDLPDKFEVYYTYQRCH